MLEAFGDELDEELLRDSLRTGGAEDVLEALRRIAAADRGVDDQLLRDVLTQLHDEETDQ